MSNRSDGFRHESIQTYERLIQQLGIDNNFDVDLFDYVYPNESIPNPFYIKAPQQPEQVRRDLRRLLGRQQPVRINRVFTGTDASPCQGVPAGTVVNEQQAFQDYIRNGGGVRRHPRCVGLDAQLGLLQGADRAASSSNHGNNTGAQQPQCPSCNITEVGRRGQVAPVDQAPAEVVPAPRRAVQLRRHVRPTTREQGRAHPLSPPALTLTTRRSRPASRTASRRASPTRTNDDRRHGRHRTRSTRSPGYGADHPISWCQNFAGGRIWANIMYHNWEPAYARDVPAQHPQGHRVGRGCRRRATASRTARSRR